MTKRKHIISIVVIVVLFIASVISWLVYQQLQPPSLGDKLEYVGKNSYGCLVFCDSNPYSNYYYATNMSPTEALKYFERATLVQGPRTENEQTDFTVRTPTGETIYINYYDGDSSIARKFNVKNKYILEIPSFKYEIAKESL